MSNDNDENDRRVVLSPAQKRVAAELRGLGLTPSQARREVLTPDQKQEHDRQIRDAELRRYEKNPHREIIMRARQSANSARKRGVR